MPGFTTRLLLLAFDHRASFTRDLFGLSAPPTAVEAARIADAKSLIYGGFLRARALGAPRGQTGILVDETFGAEIARRALADGSMLAMPVEQSGQRVFDFAYGAEFGAHIERFDPTFAKVLVRDNPDDAEGRSLQHERLKRLSEWLRAHDRRFLFELLVPPSPAQLASVGDDADRFDRELRPALVVRAIADLQNAGVEPDLWKIEGLETPEACVQVVAQARAGDRDEVACIVLGRGASQDRVGHWLRVAAPVRGFQGFAVGRTIWADALAAHRDGTSSRDAAIEAIAARYLWAIETYLSAASSPA